MPERFLVYEAKRTRNPKFVFRAIRPDGTAVHAIRLDEDDRTQPDATVAHGRDEAIRAVLRQAGYGGR
jgi:hypothetical protein